MLRIMKNIEMRTSRITFVKDETKNLKFFFEEEKELNRVFVSQEKK